MIIGPDFIWLHFPKCAGTAQQSALRRVHLDRADIAFDPINQANVIWHHSIRERQRHDVTFNPSGKRILCGFRRLPYWLLSRVHFEVQRPPHRITTRTMLVRGQFYEQGGLVGTADAYVKKYNEPKVDAWIRTEYLVDDLSRALAIDRPLLKRAVERGTASKTSHVQSFLFWFPRALLNRTVKHKNASETSHIRDLAFWFTPEELAKLYATNPEWTRVEESLYGGVLTL